MSQDCPGLEMPNLLEIAEAHGAPDTAASPSMCADEGSDSSPPAPCAVSMCADEGPSDARLKTDIEAVGTTVHGLPLYRYRYLDSPGRYEGVMAQDVLAVMPAAVAVGQDGFYRVNYRLLGTSLKRLH